MPAAQPRRASPRSLKTGHLAKTFLTCMVTLPTRHLIQQEHWKGHMQGRGKVKKPLGVARRESAHPMPGWSM